MITIQSEIYDGKCCDDENPLRFRVKFKGDDKSYEFTSANKAFGNYLGYSVFAKCGDDLVRIERRLTENQIESIELMGKE